MEICGGFKIESPGGVRGLGGGYLLSHFRSTIGVVRLNFSVRNGKRWIPHAITTLFFFLRHLSVRIRLRILTETLVTLVAAFVTLRLACLPDSRRCFSCAATMRCSFPGKLSGD